MDLHAGTWWHAGFHLTTAIVGPTVLTLPYALRGMGWALGLTLLSVMAAVTFYEYSLMSRVLDHCEARGRRHIRFRELAADVLGKYTPLPSTGNLPDGSIINRRHPLVHPHVLGGWVRVARDSGVNAAHPHALGVVLALALASRVSRACVLCTPWGHGLLAGQWASAHVLEEPPGRPSLSCFLLATPLN